jgi:hypothetical protein
MLQKNIMMNTKLQKNVTKKLQKKYTYIRGYNIKGFFKRKNCIIIICKLNLNNIILFYEKTFKTYHYFVTSYICIFFL